MFRARRLAAVLLLAAPIAAASQTPSAAQANSATRAGLKGTYDLVKNNILKSVAQVGEQHYSYKPTPEVRSMGQLFGHIANANFMICAAAIGEKSPGAKNYETVTAKAEMEKAVADSFAYCDKAWTAIEGAKGAEPVKIFSFEHTRASALAFNAAHDWEHYGNLVTYMRLRGMVPPSSQGGGGN